VATNDHPSGRVVRYLTSRKHLAGTAGGVVGVGLALAGLGGPLWPIIVAGLYGAGALAAPTDPPAIDVVKQLLASAATEATALRADLAQIGDRVRCSVADGQLPATALERFEGIEHQLVDMLAHPNALADPDVLHVLSTTIRKDLDRSVAHHLALPTRLRDRPLPGGDRNRSPADELLHQLQLLDDYLSETCHHVFGSQTQDIVNLTDYLESRQLPDSSLHHQGEDESQPPDRGP